MKDLRLLAVETSSARGSLALARINGSQFQLLQEASWEKKSSHSEIISLELMNLLQKCSWALEDLSHIAVGVGPGSFTGIRVGVNFAKSLAYSLNLPIQAVHSLQILAQAYQKEPLPLLVLINAFRNQVYMARYEKGQEVLSPQLIDLQDLDKRVQTPHICLGDGRDAYYESLDSSLQKYLLPPPSGDFQFPKARDLAAFVSQGFRPEKFLDWNSIKPLYIRASSAEEKLESGAIQTPLKI